MISSLALKINWFPVFFPCIYYISVLYPLVLLSMYDYHHRGRCWKESLLDIVRLGYYRYWNPVLSLSDWEYHWHSFLSLEIFVDLLRRHSNRIAMMFLSQFLVYTSLIQLSSPPIQIRDNLKTLAFYYRIHSIFRF